jgi:hypothetical protein
MEVIGLTNSILDAVEVPPEELELLLEEPELLLDELELLLEELPPELDAEEGVALAGELPPEPSLHAERARAKIVAATTRRGADGQSARIIALSLRCRFQYSVAT